MLRETAVAGYFYPEKEQELVSFFRQHASEAATVSAIGALVPHAGYMYSGRIAVNTLSRIHIPDTVLLMGPNHTGFGESVAVFAKGGWATPLGTVPVAEEIAEKLLQCTGVEADIVAHVREHSLEVIVPILKWLNPAVRIVPVTMMGMRFADCVTLAGEMAQQLAGEDILVVTSSDLNHYENAVKTEQKDKLAIDSLLRMEPRGLYDTVMNHEISMCGIYPAVVSLEICKRRGAKKGNLVQHAHSGEVGGDTDRVVGYAGVIFQ